MTTSSSDNPGARGRAVAGAASVAGVPTGQGSRSGIAWLGEGSQLFILSVLGIGAFVLLMMLLSFVSELFGGGGAGEAVDPGTGTITLALSTEPPQLDSTRATDMVSGQILGHVMEGLVRYDEFDRIVPGVAERWEVGGSEAVFHLRDDSRWSDGTPVTAHDFVFAWRKAVEPATASQYAFILYPIKNARAVNNGELPVTALGATAVDELTLEVRLERPIGYFDKLVAFPTYYPIKQAFYEGRDGRYGADAVDLLYNGPFVIERWVHGAQLRMSRNDEYWDHERIRLNTIDYAYITSDVNATLNLYKDGKVAVAGLDAETLHDALEQRWKLERFNDGSVFFIEFNHRPSRLTSNRNLRKAIQFVLDPAELVYKVIKLPGNTPGESLFPVWLKGVNGYFRQEYPAPEHRVDLARAHDYLERAKQELGLDPLPPLIFLSGDNPAANKQSEYFQEVFASRLGIEVKIDRQIFKQRLAKMTSGDFDMVLAGWGPDYADPLTFGDLFASWNKNNRGEYANSVLDGWVEVAQSSLVPEERMRAFDEIQKIIYDDAVILPNYERGSVFVRNPRLEGVVRRAVGTDPDYTNAYIVDG
ncbi:MAG: peptide ABC transporter substrate-binding protein [Gammaproteobacteria bacterium]|nr:peptide ABC transporter substrate-binding protein [Gammaproteobacteria bacterium]